jgi:DNA-binding MarR family transcriptional regulator
MKAASVPSLRYRALLQLLRTSDTVWNASREFFARWDLGPSQFNVLNLLYGGRTGLSQTQLGRELIMHRSNVTGLVDRLEQRGLVERKSVPGDRRAYRVVLTRAGREIMDEISPVYHAKAEAVWGAISSRLLSELTGQLSEVARNAERIAQEGRPQLENPGDENRSKRG